MKTNKILIAGLIGGLVAFILGWLFYGMLLNDFFKANGGGATNVDRAPQDMVWWAMIIGHLAFGLLIAIIFGHWANIKTVATGGKSGAILGALMGLVGLIDYGATNVANINAVMANVVIMTIVSGIVGAAVGWWLGRD